MEAANSVEMHAMLKSFMPTEWCRIPEGCTFSANFVQLRKYLQYFIQTCVLLSISKHSMYL